MLIKIVIFERTHALFLHILQMEKVLGTIIPGDCKLQSLRNLSDTLSKCTRKERLNAERSKILAKYRSEKIC